MKDTLTFDQLPEAVSRIQDKLDNIEQLLLQRQEQPMGQDEIMPVAKAAIFLDLAVPTVYSKVCRKELPVNKRGKRLYFYRSELTEWISLAVKERQRKSRTRPPRNLALAKRKPSQFKAHDKDDNCRIHL